MRIKIADSITGNSLNLGVQTNPGNVENAKLFKIKRWAPKRARSFRVLRFQNTDYHGVPQDQETGYARFEVAYFTTLKEGEPIPETAEYLGAK